MELVLNDLAFQYKVNNQYELYEVVDKFINLIVHFKKYRREVQLIYDKDIKEVELFEGYNFQRIYNDEKIMKDKKTLLLGLFTRIKKVNVDSEKSFIFNNFESKLCGWTYSNNGIVISLMINEEFRSPKLQGLVEINQHQKKVVEIPNIGENDHIKVHELLLDIRTYEANPKHKLGRNWGSPMDLNDDIAQKVLDEAIVYNNDDKCLVNFYNNKYYVFRRHINNFYHGYIDNNIPENIKNKLKR